MLHRKPASIKFMDGGIHIIAGDFDHDGDIDYIVGNLGKNSYFREAKQYPVHVYGKDFDNNGIYDMITSFIFRI